MTLKHFLQRSFFHAAAAATCGYVLLLVLERLLPGSVSPFLDLPDTGIVVAALLVASAAMPSETGRVSQILQVVFIALALLFGGFFLWTRINALGLSGLVLLGAYGVIAVLSLVAIFGRTE